SYSILLTSSEIPYLYYLFFFFYCSVALQALHSFPTRRSSDLIIIVAHDPCQDEPIRPWGDRVCRRGRDIRARGSALRKVRDDKLDRKSTRLNSSHVSISYAVFCLKKKN